MESNTKRIIFVMIVWWPVTLTLFICGLPYFFIQLLSKGIKDDITLQKTIKIWQEKLSLSEIIITGKINPKSDLTKAKPDKLISKKYHIDVCPNFLMNKEAVIVHELLHVKKGHCNLPDEPNIFFHTLINLCLDIIVDLAIIPLWISGTKNIHNTKNKITGSVIETFKYT